ncbi:MAG TPA: HesA/MoeB/ThiF family protein [Syntrophomonadaceae bacterium]|nr:HesA/MoeB/ThiF family protein [Syntrophomonadaceae bacterium]
MTISKYVLEKANNGILSWPSELEITEQTGVTIREVDEAALAHNIMPGRYSRNLPALSVGDQYRLFQSRVGIVGCGGLGGYIIEELARIGIGEITAIDYDVFEEHNLNRQLLSQPLLLGQSKARAAAERVRTINPAVKINALTEKLESGNGAALLAGCQAVADALDNISTRKILAKICDKLNVPLIHGAIGGWYGQVTTQYPGGNAIDLLYGHTNDESLVKSGMMVFAPAATASFQTAEIVKVLLNKGQPLRNRIMFINLLEMETEVMELSPAGQD